MMCNTAVELAPHDDEAASRVQAHTALVRDAFRAKLAEGQAAGELAKSTDIGSLAEFLATTCYTLGFLRRAGFGDAYLRRHLKTALATIR